MRVLNDIDGWYGLFYLALAIMLLLSGDFFSFRGFVMLTCACVLIYAYEISRKKKNSPDSEV